MATALSVLNKVNLENYTLIWLDQSVDNASEIIEAQLRLRKAINYLKLFKTTDECSKYIQSLSKYDCIIMIVSGRLGQDIVPIIHSLPQIHSIYVYCMNREKYKQWSKQYYKINRIMTDLPDLVKIIHEDQIERQQTRIHDPFLLHTLQTNNPIDELKNSFVYIDILIKCLMKINSTMQDKSEFLKICREYYAGNESELQIIQEFEENYFPSRALWWYTRPSFFSRIINRALQIEDINILLRLSFFLRDMKRQLEKNQCQSKIRVFCARIMSNDDIKVLKTNENSFIIINTFLLTTTKEQVKKYFNHDIFSNGFQFVLFDIEADPHMTNIKPFSQITTQSYFNNQEQTLFMLGSIFRLGEIRKENDGMWTVQMYLCSENDLNIKSNYIEKYTKDSLSFGRFFYESEHFNIAEQYYLYLLDDLPYEHSDTALMYDALGDLEIKKCNYLCSHEYFNKAFDIRQKIFQGDNSQIGDSYFNFGKIYYKKNETKQALNAFHKAIDIYSKTFNSDHLKIGACYDGMGDIYTNTQKYSNALECYEKVLRIRQKSLASNHHQIGDCFQKIADTYLTLKNFDKASTYFKYALDVYKKSDSPSFFNIGMIWKNLANIHEQNKRLTDACKCYEEALTYFQRIFSSEDKYVIDIQNNIQRIKGKI